MQGALGRGRLGKVEHLWGELPAALGQVATQSLVLGGPVETEQPTGELALVGRGMKKRDNQA